MTQATRFKDVLNRVDSFFRNNNEGCQEVKLQVFEELCDVLEQIGLNTLTEAVEDIVQASIERPNGFLENKLRNRSEEDISDFLSDFRNLVLSVGRVAELLIRRNESKVESDYFFEALAEFTLTSLTACYELSMALSSDSNEDQRISLKEAYDDCKVFLELLGFDNFGHSRYLSKKLRATSSMFSVLFKLDFSGFCKAAKLFLKHLKTLRNEDLIEGLQDIIDKAVACISDFCTEILEDIRSMLMEDDSKEILDSKVGVLVRKATFLLRMIKEVVVTVQCGDNINNFLKLLATLSRYNEQSIATHPRLKSELRQQVSVILPAWVQTLLMELVKFPGFSDSILQTQILEDTYAEIQLRSILLSNLPKCSEEARSKLMRSIDENLLKSIYSRIDECKEMNEEPFIVGIAHSGKPPEVISAYEHTLTHVQAFLFGANVREMAIIQEILFHELLRSSIPQNFWRIKFLSDVWCFIARCGKSSFCLEHVTLLCTVIQSKKLHHLNHLLFRLSSFLTSQDLDNLEKSYRIEENLIVWSNMSPRPMSANLRNSLIKESVTVLQTTPKTMAKPSEIGVALKFCSSAWEFISQGEKKRIATAVKKMWLKLEKSHFVASKSRQCVMFLNGLFTVSVLSFPLWTEKGQQSVIRSVDALTRMSRETFLTFMYIEFLWLLSQERNLSLSEDQLMNAWTSIALASVSDGLLEFHLLTRVPDSRSQTVIDANIWKKAQLLRNTCHSGLMNAKFLIEEFHLNAEGVKATPQSFGDDLFNTQDMGNRSQQSNDGRKISARISEVLSRAKFEISQLISGDELLHCSNLNEVLDQKFSDIEKYLDNLM